MVFIHSRLIKSKQVRFQIFNTRHVNCYCSLLLFCVREINRFLEIPFRESRKILRVSRNSKLDPRFSKLETRASKLDSRFAKTSRIEDRVSSRDCQLTFARYCTCNLKMAASPSPVRQPCDRAAFKRSCDLQPHA